MRKQGFIILIAFLLSASLASADNKKLDVSHYHLWQQLSSKQLIRLADHYYYHAEQFDSALLCYNFIANRYYETNRKDTAELRLVARAMNQLSSLYFYHFYDYQKTHSYLLMAQEIAERHHFTDEAVSAYISLSNLYKLKSQMKGDAKVDSTTFLQHRKAYRAAIDSGNWNDILTAAYNYATLGDDDDIAKNVSEDLRLFLKLNVPDTITNRSFVALFCQGMMASQKGDYEKALSLYEKAYASIDTTSQRTLEVYQMSVLNTKTRLLIKMGRHEDVEALLLDMIHREKDNHYNLYVLYLALHDYYEYFHDDAKAKEYELLYLREKNIVMENDKMLDAGQTELLFNVDKMNEELQRLAYERRIQRIITSGIILLTLLLLYIAFLLYRRWRKTQATNRQLYQRTQDLLAAEEEHRQQLLDYEERLKQIPEVENAPVSQRPTPQKYRTHQVSDEEHSELLHRILYIMETSDEIYSNDFSLARLTELVNGRTPNYVSQAINQHYHRNFSDMLNEYRIREACRRMNDKELFRQYSNDTLAESVGFKSYPNFVRNFKKFTGLTPSAYQKQAKEGATTRDDDNIVA